MDISYLLMLQNFREATHGIFNSFFAYITTYGEEFLTMMIAAAIYWCVDKKQGAFTMMTWGAGRLLNGFLKVTACVYRPWIRDVRIEPVSGAKTAATGYSFPSGHTTNATVVFGSLAMDKKATKCFRWFMILMVLLVAFSRNYLGVHTPQDVLVGCGVTVALLFFVKWMLEKVDEKPNLDIVVLIVGIILSVAVIVYATVKGYPRDYDPEGKLIVDPAKMRLDTYKGCGFSIAVLISWFIDRRWLHYEVKGTPASKITYYVVGILGYFVLSFVLIPLFPKTIFGAVLDRFVRLTYVMLIVPFFIKMASKKQLQ